MELEGAQAMGLGRLLATVASGWRGAWAALGGRLDAVRHGCCATGRRGFCCIFFLSVGFIQTICND